MEKASAQRRGYGDGSVYQRKDGRWVARLMLPGKNTVYRYAKTEPAAKRLLRELKQSPEVLAKTNAKIISVHDYFKQWLSVFKMPTLKKSSYDRLDSVINNTIAKELGEMRVADVTPKDCQEVINKLVDEGKSFSSIKKVYDTMGDCFKHAFLSGDIPMNPMLVVTCPSSSNFENKDVRALTEDEESKLLSELDKKYISSGKPIYTYKDAYIAILNTGMRLGEMVALDWSDVDLESMTVHVWKTAIIVSKRDSDGNATGKQEQIIQNMPKTKAGNRVIPLNQKALNAFQRLKDSSGGSEFVLNTSTKKRTYCNTLFRQLSRAYKNCMIANAGVHTLRHTFATKLFNKGADVKDVSVLLGHSSVTITYNTYIHVIKERKENVVKLLDDNA